MIQLLIVRMVGDDGESTRTDPDPQVFLKGFRGVNGPNSASSHLYEAEASVSLLSESIWQKSKLSRVRAWEAAWRFLHVFINYNVPALRVDNHSILVEGPRIYLRANMLITALVMVHLNAIIFLDKRLLVATAERFWVISCSGGLRWLIAIRLAKLWANPLRHGESAN